MVAAALGDPVRRMPESKYLPVATAEPVEIRHETVGVLFLGEVAARLEIRRAEVERMIASGRLHPLPTGFTFIVPISEVERLS